MEFFLMLYRISDCVTFCKNNGKLKSYRSTQSLSRSEKEILYFLCIKNGSAVSKENLKQKGWPELDVSDQSLIQAIYSLRKKLSTCGSDDVISTVFNHGYAISAVEVILEGSFFSRIINKVTFIKVFFFVTLLPFLFYYPLPPDSNKVTLLHPLINYEYNENHLTTFSNENLSGFRNRNIELFSDKLPRKSKLFYFFTNKKTYVMACPLNNSSMICNETVSSVLELPANEENIPKNQVKEWFSMQQEINTELPFSSGLMMTSNNYMFIGEILTMISKYRFILEFNKSIGSGYQGKYKNSILYSRTLNKKNIFSSHGGDFTLSYYENTGREALILNNQKKIVTPFKNKIIRNEALNEGATNQHVIWKIEQWGNQSLWLSLSAKKMWVFEESPLY